MVVDRATAGAGYPRYERLALRLIGINEFLWLADAHDGPAGRNGGVKSRPVREEIYYIIPNGPCCYDPASHVDDRRAA
jgi:hypothetical protein